MSFQGPERIDAHNDPRLTSGDGARNSSRFPRGYKSDIATDPRLLRIRAAMEPGVMSIVFQPVVDLRRGVVAGAEALARFAIEPLRTPDVWFNEAWDVGLGVELEVAAIRKALVSLESLPEGTHLAVNASPQTLMSPQLDAALVDVACHRVIVELTEHAKVEDYAAVSPAVQRLRARGIRLAIDDAGAGFSSLQHILHLRPDLIKLDRSLTQAIDTDPVRYALAAALVTFAGSLDAAICAEGIEKETELAALQRLGIAFGQGYLLGRPLPLPIAPPPKGVWLCEDEAHASYDRFKQAAPVSSTARADSLRPPVLAPSTYPSPVVLDRDRLAATHAAALLDTPSEESFDRITRWASEFLHAPVAMFTVIDHDRQFSKSSVGISDPAQSSRDTPLSHSLCQHVVTANGPLVIGDAAQHPLVRENGAVRDGVAAYLGVPVRVDGQAIGALCVVDVVPHAWTSHDMRVLAELAAAIMTELDLRETQRRLKNVRQLITHGARSARAFPRRRARTGTS